jgi:hypothetical protein
MYHFLSSKQFDNFLVYSIYVLHLNYPSTFFVFMENMFWVLILRTAPRVPCCSPAACRTVCQPRVFCQPHAALHRAAGLHLHGPCPRPGQAEHPRALRGLEALSVDLKPVYVLGRRVRAMICWAPFHRSPHFSL